MKPPVPGWKRIQTKATVHIPDHDGNTVARTVEVEVPAWQDDDGELFFDGHAMEILDKVKAKYMERAGKGRSMKGEDCDDKKDTK